MSDPANQLPANVLEALRRGNAVEAIKLLRESTGLGLTEAKGVIDQHLRGRPGGVVAAATAAPLPPAVAAALARGNKIEAIKLLREQSGVGLKEAKDAIEASPAETRRPAEPQAPGEIPRSGSLIWLVVAVAALAGYYFLRGAA